VGEDTTTYLIRKQTEIRLHNLNYFMPNTTWAAANGEGRGWTTMKRGSKEDNSESKDLSHFLCKLVRLPRQN